MKVISLPYFKLSLLEVNFLILAHMDGMKETAMKLAFTFGENHIYIRYIVVYLNTHLEGGLQPM